MTKPQAKERHINRRVALELKNLDWNQRQAVQHEGNVVVTAGPGSGKTRALVARAAYLLDVRVSPFRAVGCITYTRAAAGEISERLIKLGPTMGARITARTFHSFCLTEILHPYSSLVGMEPPRKNAVIDTESQDTVDIITECFDELGINHLNPNYWYGSLTTLRRAISVGEKLDSYDSREVAAARLFDGKLQGKGLIDFEAMAFQALTIMESSEQARDLFQSRYPHLLVDEYQDLGGVLHNLVECLREKAGVEIFAVGDIDQSMYEFNGARPEYLRSLKSNPAYKPFDLIRNYRSAENLFPLFTAALGEDRGHIGVRQAHAGTYQILEVPSGADLDHHAQTVVEHARRLIDEGTAPERIAVLYPGKGPMREHLLAQLAVSDVPFFDYRGDSLPFGDLFDFVRLCARRINRIVRRSGDGDPDPSLETLAQEYQRLRRIAPIPAAGKLLLLSAIREHVDEYASELVDVPPSEWVEALAERLEMASLEEFVTGRTESGLDQIIQHALKFDAMTDYLESLDPLGKVSVTTFWGAKGLEFEAVIIPGLVNGVFPRETRNGQGQWVLPSGPSLDEARRIFYVALTRAEREVVLIGGQMFRPQPQNRQWIKRKGLSILLQELKDGLGI